MEIGECRMIIQISYLKKTTLGLVRLQLKKFLFMDDDKMVRTMANEMLSHYGYEVFLSF
jgi:3-methyladenine DNA glycosylase AlkD